ERIQQALEAPFQLEGHTLFVTTSIGIAFGHQASKRPGDYLRDADNAMYRAKKNKNMPYAIFDKKMHAKAVERLQLEAELRHGLINEQFVLHYQPIIDCNRGCISGFEALVRWQHPTRGLLYPDLFVPLAEESNLINTLGWWVFEAACKQLLRWQQVFDPTLRININISSRQLTAKDALSTIQQIASQSGVLPEYVGLEITETMLMEQTEEAISLLQKLKEQQFYICMDDFGTGYSSLAYLQHFPINTLKIDRSFVMDMAKGGKQRTLVRTIVSLAEHFGLDVVAEGVEQKEHLEDLKDWGCRYMQGYYFSKPIPSSEAEILLSHQTQWLLEKHATRESI
ncbi:MAG TPA: hypothetical protein DCE42_14145, partial [Myxococcales bacterium]|nr:hypothetical protein [Myxococcales bacterium]